MDQKTPFGNIDTLFNKLTQSQQTNPNELPKLPFDLNKLGQSGGLLDNATAAYCTTQHPELYTYAAIAGAVASGTFLLGTIGLVFLIGKMVKTVRGRA